MGSACNSTVLCCAGGAGSDQNGLHSRPSLHDEVCCVSPESRQSSTMALPDKTDLMLVLRIAQIAGTSNTEHLIE